MIFIEFHIIDHKKCPFFIVHNFMKPQTIFKILSFLKSTWNMKSSVLNISGLFLRKMLGTRYGLVGTRFLVF